MSRSRVGPKPHPSVRHNVVDPACLHVANALKGGRELRFSRRLVQCAHEPNYRTSGDLRERERETEGLDRFAATPNSTFDSMVHGPSQHIPAMRASQMFGTDYT